VFTNWSTVIIILFPYGHRVATPDGLEDSVTCNTLKLDVYSFGIWIHYLLMTKIAKFGAIVTSNNKNSSGDEIANVNFYAVRPGSYRNSLK